MDKGELFHTIQCMPLAQVEVNQTAYSAAQMYHSLDVSNCYPLGFGLATVLALWASSSCLLVHPVREVMD